MKLEGQEQSAFDHEIGDVDPFSAATGYYRIALDDGSRRSLEAKRYLVIKVALACASVCL